MDNMQFKGSRNATLLASEPNPDDTHKGTYEGELVLSQADLARIIQRRLWVVALVGIIFAGAAAGFALMQTPTYEASIKIMIRQERSGDTPPPDLGNEFAGLQQLTATLVEAVQTGPVAQSAIQRLDLSMSQSDFLERLSAEQIGTTSFIEVTYTDASPARAQRIANTVGEVFSDKVSETSPSANPIVATLWERAILPDSPANPTTLRDTLLALTLGLMLGAGLAFLLEYLDKSRKA